jgi:REP element-mobilizing transposase RayT
MCFSRNKVDAASSRAVAEESGEDASSTLFREFDFSEAIGHLSGNLPHWRQDGATYFITFRTADSLPQEKLKQWLDERTAWLRANKGPYSAAQQRDYWEKFPARIQHWLDQNYGDCMLRRADLQQIVTEALMHFHGDRYRLDEFVIMPNHVHALVAPIGESRLSAIMHAWKFFTALRINRKLNRHGAFWQKESFDHIVRTAKSLDKFREYIRANPRPAP